jgi:hypothetical protein
MALAFIMILGYRKFPQNLSIYLSVLLCTEPRLTFALGGAPSRCSLHPRAYRWLRLCDLLSLALCADFMPESGLFESIPGSEPDELININYHRPHPFELHLDPYPFNQPVVQMTIQTRRLGELTYPDQADYLVALKSTPWIPQTIKVSAI